MVTPQYPRKSSDRPAQPSSSGQPQAAVYDSPTMNPESRGTDSASYVDPDEINLLDYLRIIHKYRWMILGITFVAMVATVTWSLRQPRMYQASASIVPPIRSQPGGLASRFGVGSSILQGMLSEGNPSSLYEGILKSRSLADTLIDRFNLMKVNGQVKTRTAARATLKSNTSIKTSRGDSIIHITVTDYDPNKAAALCSGYVEELDQQNRRLSGGQATSKRIFLENRLKEIQDELSKIDTLQSREARNKEMLFEMLARECEFAKMEEAKSMPTIQVLDRAVVPEQGMARGTVKRGLMAGLATMMLGIFIAFGRGKVQGIKTTATVLNPCQPVKSVSKKA